MTGQPRPATENAGTAPRRPAAPWSLIVALLLALALPWPAVAAPKLPAGGDKSAKPAALPDTAHLSPGQVDGLLSPLTDEQARRLLRRELSEKAAARQEPEAAGPHEIALLGLFVGAEEGLRDAARRFTDFFAEAGAEVSDGPPLAERLRGQADPAAFGRSLLVLCGLLLASLAAMVLTERFFNRLTRLALANLESSRLGRPGLILARVVMRLIAAGVFLAVAFVLFMAAMPSAGPAHDTGLICVIALTYYFLIRAFAQSLLAPGEAATRPMPMADADALTLYRWLMAVSTLGMVLAIVSAYLKWVPRAMALSDMVHASAGVLSGLVLTAMILANRRRVAQAIAPPGQPEADSPARRLMARYWHLPAVAYALFIGCYWSLRALVEDITILRLILSLFLIPACIGLDLWARKLLAVAAGQDRQIIPIDAGPDRHEDETAAPPQGPAAPDRRSIHYYIPLIRKILRVALIVFPVFAMLRTWGVEIPLGWLFARNVLSIVLVVVAGLLAWEIIRIRIDRKLKEEGGLPGDEMEDGGGSGGSRSATLLMLLRKFILTVIVVIGSLVALSSLGVDIGPLIAGAGVIGLAIGFGAQTLVKDIISGVFFLIDDAFRVGDYVEAGTAKGTVEQISLRSMKLRHPRGMIFTIPYGGLKIIQNFSRDYIISKLDFRVRYDADIDKIRKIIKRINKEIMANEELNAGMLSDIKSMGVRKMEDSAMILRIKYKTIPGHQFTVQKEIYRRVQEAFLKNGIEFAHRNVTVYLPPDVASAPGGAPPSPETARAVLSGAAGATILEQERLEAAAKAGKE